MKNSLQRSQPGPDECPVCEADKPIRSKDPDPSKDRFKCRECKYVWTVPKELADGRD